MSLAAVFPGQGSQSLGMGQAMAAAFPTAKRVFDEASEQLGYDMLALCADGPKERLSLTEYTQPAILTVSVAAYRVWAEQVGLSPDYAAGHSLGEYAALVASGSLSFSDAVRVVQVRGRAMQEAVPVGEGAMAAVLNLELSAVEAICQDAAQGRHVMPANMNAPGQIVISGHADAVERAGQLARERGAKRVLPLDVSAPFHCRLMAPAADALREVLADTAFGPLGFTVLANVDAQPYRMDGSDARERLVAQVCAPVQWEGCVRAMEQGSVTRSVEFGIGRIVSALIKRCARDIELTSVETPEDLGAWIAN